jgi:hypothetical protein
VGWQLLVWSKHRFMTPGMVHVTNLTPGSADPRTSGTRKTSLVGGLYKELLSFYLSRETVLPIE